MSRLLIGSLALLMALAACSGDTSPEADGVRVVTTTSVLGDVVESLVGNEGSVVSLMEAGADPHDFSPSADQVATLREADLVVANGLGLEANVVDVLDSAAADGSSVVELAELVAPLPFGDHEEDGHDGEGHEEEGHEGEGHEEEGHEGEAHEEEAHEHGDLDPHFFLDPLRMADAVDVVAAALAEQAPDVDWEERAGSVRADLEALHREIEETLSVVPAEQRKLVANHDALGYFADRYGFEVVGVVIQGGSTMAEPSASDLAELAETLRQEGVTDLFTDVGTSTQLAETVAAEVGGDVEVHQLYTGTLGEEGSEAETYADMMRTNASTIAAALED